MVTLTIGQRVLLRDLGGELFKPPVVINGFTRIDVEDQIDPAALGQFGKGKYYKVKILEGAFRNMEGYLPRPAISLLSPTAFQGVGLSTDMAPKSSKVRYGMDTKVNNEYVVWQAYCAHCGESPALHILHETQQKSHRNGTSEDLQTLRHAITNAKALLNNPKLYNNLFIKSADAEVMLGVLHVASGRVYASHSNRKNNDGFQGVVQALGWVYGTVPSAPILNRRLEKATNGKPDSDLQAFEYQCAAARLIQTALNDGEYPVAMTEGYYGGAAAGHTIRSCYRCVNRIPYMLCPE